MTTSTEGRRIKVLIAKPGLDGHDVGAKLVARALMEAGMDVIYTGLRQSPQAIARAAAEEDVDVVGLSVLSGSHVPLCREVAAALQGFGASEKLWLVGGNIPKRDHATLTDLGVDAIFPVGCDFEDIVALIRERCQHTQEASR